MQFVSHSSLVVFSAKLTLSWHDEYYLYAWFTCPADTKRTTVHRGATDAHGCLVERKKNASPRRIGYFECDPTVYYSDKSKSCTLHTEIQADITPANLTSTQENLKLVNWCAPCSNSVVMGARILAYFVAHPLVCYTKSVTDRSLTSRTESTWLSRESRFI